MMRYTLVFLLVNSYGRSLGVPVQDISNGKILIGNLLGELSKQCQNEFVLGQIASKNNACNVELPPFHDDNLQCLLFFDANRLMCNLTDSNTDLTTEFTAKLSEKQSASTFCGEAAQFNVPSAAYQKTISAVFQNDVACKKVCADDDLWTGDTNFYCKYYKWSLHKLNALQSSTLVLKSTVNPVGSGVSGLVEEKNDTSTPIVQASDGQVKLTSDTVLSITKPQSAKGDEINQHPSEVAKPDTSSIAQFPVVQNQENSQLLSAADNLSPKKTEGSVQVQHTGVKAGDVDKPQNVHGDSIDGVGNEAGIDNNGGGIKDPDVTNQQIETPGQRINLENDDGDDASMDMENDDGKEGNLDTIDDRDDQMDSEVEVNIDKKPKNSEKQIEIQSVNGDGSQREFFQNPDGFTADDDHFFPFFLTAVIVVAVLYVLYHNKNKVSKMFFGLIVEGRQPGRRRNSRGHAYRRLDTLEQAMSANAAAPPSKIIY